MNNFLSSFSKNSILFLLLLPVQVQRIIFFSLKQVDNKNISQIIDLLLLDNQISFKKMIRFSEGELKKLIIDPKLLTKSKSRKKPTLTNSKSRSYHSAISIKQNLL